MASILKLYDGTLTVESGLTPEDAALRFVQILKQYGKTMFVEEEGMFLHATNKEFHSGVPHLTVTLDFEQAACWEVQDVI